MKCFKVNAWIWFPVLVVLGGTWVASSVYPGTPDGAWWWMLSLWMFWVVLTEPVRQAKPVKVVLREARQDVARPSLVKDVRQAPCCGEDGAPGCCQGRGY